MLLQYKYTLDCFCSDVIFLVNTSIFTEELAKTTLDYFDYYYDEDDNLIDQVLPKYATSCLKMATFSNLTLEQLISEFSLVEGFAEIDGSRGIELISIDKFVFDENDFSVDVEPVNLANGIIS